MKMKINKDLMVIIGIIVICVILSCTIGQVVIAVLGSMGIIGKIIAWGILIWLIWDYIRNRR